MGLTLDTSTPADTRPIMRVDTVLIEVDDDPIPWTRAQGGEGFVILDWYDRDYGKRQYAPLTLARHRSDATAREVAKLVGRLYGPVTVTLSHLKLDGSRTGGGLRYRGTLTRVSPGDCDANSYDVLLDEIVVQPTEVVAL